MTYNVCGGMLSQASCQEMASASAQQVMQRMVNRNGVMCLQFCYLDLHWVQSTYVYQRINEFQ